ncbi:MAG: glycosyltransferase family 9 protein, partial [Nitrospinae bacterium]|nr:glycosyltransferase family 9 protein [Nitrospinota bacterium]
MEYNTAKIELFSSWLGLNVTSKDMSVTVLSFNNIPIKEYIVIACGADEMAGSSSQTKVWPQENWIAVVAALSEHIQVVQVGGSSDFVVTGAHSLVGKTSITEAAYVIQRAKFVVSTDGGMIHIAKALKKKTVVLWGPTVPKIFGYLDQINIVYDQCPCAFQVPDWTIRCHKGT